MGEYSDLEVRTDLGEDLKQWILAKLDRCHELLGGNEDDSIHSKRNGKPSMCRVAHDAGKVRQHHSQRNTAR